MTSYSKTHSERNQLVSALFSGSFCFLPFRGNDKRSQVLHELFDFMEIRCFSLFVLSIYSFVNCVFMLELLFFELDKYPLNPLFFLYPFFIESGSDDVISRFDQFDRGQGLTWNFITNVAGVLFSRWNGICFSRIIS